MSSSSDAIKMKMIDFVCKVYISKGPGGKIAFKSSLGKAIDNGDIFEEDGESIVLELMHNIKRYNLNHESILDELDNLILKVKEYNSDGEASLKKSVLFFHDYSFEIEVLSEYVKGLTPDETDQQVKENSPQKTKPINIKQYLKEFSREELCFILDINPDLNYDGEKKLKRQIADEFSKYPFDENKLEGASCKDIKNYLDSLARDPQDDKIDKLSLKKGKKRINPKDSLNNKNRLNDFKSNDKKIKSDLKNISKLNLDNLLDIIRSFNYKKLKTMVSLKQEYAEVYQKVSKIGSEEFNRNGDVKRFKYYFEHFDLINDCIVLIDKIKQKEILLNKFHAELNRYEESKKLFDMSKTKVLLNLNIFEVNELYVLVYNIKNYPYCLKDKIIDEFDNLEYFIENYENILNSYDFNTNDYIEKIRLLNLNEKMKSFNNKKFSDMISLKQDYVEVYDEISSNVYGKFNEMFNVKQFKYYFEHFNLIKECIVLINKIKQKEKLLDSFCHRLHCSGYLSNSKRKEIINDYNQLYGLVGPINNYSDFLKYKIMDEFDDLGYFLEFYELLINYDNLDDDNSIKDLNEAYISGEIQDNKHFFKDINDPNKKRAIVCDEDNIKVVAGAGAGKTFIIQKKIEYLTQRKENPVDPDRILCLCYTKKGVNQLNKKVNKPSSNHKVKVFTFHEFCRRVSNECGENKSSNRYLLDGVIRKYVKKIVRNPKKLDKLCQYFSYYSTPRNEYEEYHEQNKFVSLKKKYNYCDNGLDVSERKKYSLCHEYNETVEGECVKSMGELLIANYLFMHNIEYRYENQYPHNDMADVIENRFLHSANYFSLGNISKEFKKESIVKNFIKWERHKNYFPDFYLPKYDIYIEHFGVNENMEATFLEGEEKEKYERDMKYKPIQHSIYGTKLIQTYWYYLLEDSLLQNLEEELNKYPDVEIKQRSREEIIDILINNDRVKDFDNLLKLIKSFINIYESKNLQKADFDKFRSKNTSKDVYTINRQNLFFDITEDIYNEYYNEYLNKETLSHNHEIFNALKLIQSNEFDGRYDYIFVDEYQDVNPVRCKLLQVLQKNSKAKLFVVGDDWQSIYGFTGSKVSLFIDFDKYFENPEVIQIEENRRNPQKLIDISSEYIVKYNGQDERELKFYKGLGVNNPNPIKVVKYNKDSWKGKTLKLDGVIDNILKYSQNPKILILGRNNEDIDDYIGNVLFKEDGGNKIRKIIYSRRPDLDITFMTIHQAKGLEADEVIVLNLEDRDGGFPNKMTDDPILSFVKDDDEKKFAEERRLLYVALTRSRNNVYLFASVSSTSQFIKELMVFDGVIEENVAFRIQKKYLPESSDFMEEIVVNETHLDCPYCDGKISIIENNVNKTTYVRCSNHPRSSEHYDGGPYPKWGLNDIKYVKKCPKCRGILVRNGDILKCCLNYHDGCMEKDELKLDKDDLEFDYE